MSDDTGGIHSFRIMRPKFHTPLACVIFLALWVCAASANAGDFKSSYVHLARGIPALLHEPVAPGAKNNTAILIMHPSSDVLLRPFWAEQLAIRGYRVLSANTAYNHIGMTTVRRFLSTFATRSSKDYGYNENSVTGIDWNSSYNSLPGSLEGVTAPVLIVGMTGFFLVQGVEVAFDHASSPDKTLVFVEGADHHGEPCKECESSPGEYGDTVGRTFDYIDEWLSQPERF